MGTHAVRGRGGVGGRGAAGGGGGGGGDRTHSDSEPEGNAWHNPWDDVGADFLDEGPDSGGGGGGGNGGDGGGRGGARAHDESEPEGDASVNRRDGVSEDSNEGSYSGDGRGKPEPPNYPPPPSFRRNVNQNLVSFLIQ